jgi:hypothetical protein
MKTTLRTQGTVELSEKDLIEILKEDSAGRKTFASMIIAWLRDKHGLDAKSVQWPNGDVNRIAVIVDSTTDGGATPFGKPIGENGPRKSNAGFKRLWKGLYGAVGEVIIDMRKRKKNFISFEDLHAELLDMQHPGKSTKMFVKQIEGKKHELPIEVVRQRCAPSQLPRQAQRQKELKGVTVDKKRDGLSF